MPPSDSPGFEALAAFQNIGSFSALEQQYPLVFKELRSADPRATALSFAALLLHPELQSSSYRLETLVHLAWYLGNTTKKLKQKDFRHLFAQMAGTIASSEDPAEDVFVSNVATDRGDFLILEGLSEGAGYYLQLFTQLVESMPRNDSYDVLRDPVYSLLTLSNAACKKANLARNQPGSTARNGTFPTRIADEISALRSCLTFTPDELAELNVSIDSLSDFLFDPADRDVLGGQQLLHSTLERFPLTVDAGIVYLLLPTSVSTAIRYFLIERLSSTVGNDSLVGLLAREYSNRLHEIPLLGASGRVDLPFTRIGDTLFANLFQWADAGRALNLLFFMDPLTGFEDMGLGGWYRDSKATADAISDYIRHTIDKAKTNPDFRTGLTIIVGCGIGRGISQRLNLGELPNWDIDVLSVHDFELLSNMTGFDAASLWRLKEGEAALAKAGVTLGNLNGLANLVAWRDKLDGHLVPHGQIPDDFLRAGRAFIQVELNAIRLLRHKISTTIDIHTVENEAGDHITVRRASSSLSESDTTIPLYITVKPPGALPPLVFEGAACNWWMDLEIPDGASGPQNYERWKMLTTWLPRIGAALEGSLPRNKLVKALRMKAKFADLQTGLRNQPQPITPDEIRARISTAISPEDHLITISTDERFEDGFFNKDNIAEKEWVRAVVTAIVAYLGCEELNVVDAIVGKVVPNSRIRQIHAFPATEFRDFVRDKLPMPPTFIEREDQTNLKLGLAWQVQDPSLGSEILGVSECTNYLRRLVSYQELVLNDFLSQFNKASALQTIILNHESATADQETWRRTSAAVSALHNDDSTFKEILDHQYKSNGVLHASRVLVEIANCACRSNDGFALGEMDLCKAMAMADDINHYGGWSDAINLGAMEPKLKLTRLGDVFANHDFYEDVVTPFGEATMKSMVSRAIDAYDNYFAEQSEHAGRTAEPDGKARFEKAWATEFGFTVQAFISFCHSCEEVGLDVKEPVLLLKRSELRSRVLKKATDLERFLDQLFGELSLVPRPQWKDVPTGFIDTDRQPWKFRRLLSILRRPLVQMDDAKDPMICLWPGMVGDAAEYTLSNYFKGGFRDTQLRSPEMKSWAGHIGGQKTDFNAKVGREMERLGWSTRHDINVTEVLGKGTDPVFGNIKQYGDIDVLAWSAKTGSVLIFECKDLKFSKTPGEIAEQLSKFRGAVNSKGKPDLLRKHLNRVSIIKAHRSEVAKFTGLQKILIQDSLVFSGKVPVGYSRREIKSHSNVVTFQELSGKFELN